LRDLPPCNQSEKPVDVLSASERNFVLVWLLAVAPLITAALEPDSQNSFAANRVLDLEASRLRRVLRRPGKAFIGELP